MVKFYKYNLFHLDVDEFSGHVHLVANNRDLFIIRRKDKSFGREVFRLGFQLIGIGLGIIKDQAGRYFDQ